MFGEDHGEQIQVVLQRAEQIRWAVQVHEQQIVLRSRHPDGTVEHIVPDLFPFGPEAVIDAHRNMVQAIVAHPNIVGLQTEILNEHRQVTQWLAGNSQNMQRRMEDVGLLRDRPGFGEMLGDVASKLAINVDLYIHFDRIRAAHAEYSARHADIMNFIQNEASPGLLDF